MAGGIRSRLVAVCFSAIFLTTLLPAGVVAIDGGPTVIPEPRDPDAPRVVEREPIDLVMPPGGRAAGGAGEAGAFDPSIELRLEIADARPPLHVTELVDARTERTRTVANPGGSYTLEVAQGRLHYRDAEGDWQPLDLSLVEQVAGELDLAVRGHDRAIQFGNQNAEQALARLASEQGELGIRVLDFPSELVADQGASPAPSPSEAPAPSPSDPPTSGPSQPGPSASPAVPAVIAEPSPAPASPAPAVPPASAEPLVPVAPSLEPPPAPAASASPPAATPSPSPSDTPSPTPTPSVLPSPTATPIPTPTAPPAPAATGLPVSAGNVLVFERDPEAGRVVVFPTDEGFEFSVVLADAAQKATYSFALDLEGLEPSVAEDGQTILLERVHRAQGGTTRSLVGVVRAPVLFDALQVAAPADAVSVELAIPGVDTLPPTVSPAAAAALRADEVVVTYTIDPTWLADPARIFPVTLDPTVCLSAGVAGCTTSSPYIDHYVAAGIPNTYPIPTDWLRIGNSGIGDGFGSMRSFLYFSDVSLPDGAEVTTASLSLRQVDNYDGTTSPDVIARLVNQGWATNSTWNQIAGIVNGSYDSPSVAPCQAGGTDCDLVLDVRRIVRAWYTRRGQDWKPNIGIQLRYATESSTLEEIRVLRGNSPFSTSRPKLTIDYVTPEVAIDFDPSLGASYSPSTMIAGKATRLPIRVTNEGTVTLNATASSGLTYKVGYRWFDAKGKALGPGTQALPATLNAGATSALFGLDVTPPTAPGQYTLRLDVVHDDAATGPLWLSDWASPTRYYARNKKVLTADSSRWVGTSVIERAEFPINVVRGGGTNTGELRTVELGDGSEAGIDLVSRNLHFEGAGGVGFGDLLPIGVEYGYDSRHTLDCASQVSPTLRNGADHACGWYTNWDERLTETGNGAYVYQGPSGNRYFVDTDGTGQLISGAPVRLERTRHTIFDETKPVSGAGLYTASGQSIPAWSGAWVMRAPSNSDTSIGGTGTIDLNSYGHLRFAVRTSPAASAGLAVKIRNLSNPDDFPDRWYIYTLGTNWSTGFAQKNLAGSPVNTWRYHQVDAYADVKAHGGFGHATDSYQVVAMQVQAAPGATGLTFLDGMRFEPSGSTWIADTEPSWTANSGAAALTTDRPTLEVTNSQAIRVDPTPLSGAPHCQNPTCLGASSGALFRQPFVSWWWKKVGGASVAIEMELTGLRATNGVYPTGKITYYAGPVAPPDAVNPVQVSDEVPATWSQVTRNLLDDGRQILGFYNDNPAGTGASAPPSQGPVPDEVRWTGYRLWAVDGNWAVFDHLRYTSVPNVGEAFAGHPGFAGDTTATSDFIATYADGSRHGFNEDGLLEWIVDRDDNRVVLDWDIDQAVHGQAAYALLRIHAPSDETTGAGVTYQREIIVDRPSGGVGFRESVGTTASSTGRDLVFTISAADDVTRVKPARTPTCGSAGAPSGCLELAYDTSGSGHRLEYISDPRDDATTDWRTQVVWTAAGAAQIVDLAPHPNATLLRVLDGPYSAPLPAAERVLWQDTAAVRSGHAAYADLTSDGSVLTDYLPLACAAGDCAANPPSTASLSDYKRTSNQFDGLARATKTTRYVTTGSDQMRTVTRQGTKAGARVDNYVDPLRAGQLEWTQSADQWYSSLHRSAFADEDLYRTFYTYDADGNEVAVADPSWNQRPDYRGVVDGSIFSAGNLKGYWRLGETSGTSAAAVVGNGGSYVGGVTLGATGGIVNDANKAPSFDGVDDYVSFGSPSSSVTGTYTVSVWAKPAHATNPIAVLGTRTPSDFGFDVTFIGGNRITADIGTGAAWLTTDATMPVAYRPNRWYHVVYVVSPSGWSGYVNGELLGRGTFSGSPVPVLLDASHFLRIGRNGISSVPEWWQGGIDELAIYSQALTGAQVRGAYLAGRSVAVDTARTIHDDEGHPIQTDDQFLASPGFESGLADWDLSAGSGTVYAATSTSDPLVHQPADPEAPPSWASFKTGTTGNARQDVQLVPGQTFRFQVWGKRVGTTGSGHIVVRYWKRSTGAWEPLVTKFPTETSWTGHAWDLTLPLDTDGRVRVILAEANVTGSDSIYYDDAAVLTTYGRTLYRADGLVSSVRTYNPNNVSPAAELRVVSEYDATLLHPGIFGTDSIANYVDGTYSPSSPDTDVRTTTAFDRWGRPTLVTDPDGVERETAYVTSGNGEQTDVAWTEDGLDNRTTYSHDLVGNRTSVDAPSPLGTTTTTYDHGSREALISPPAPATPTRHEYDGYGFLVRTIANYVDGTAPSATSDEDVVTAYAYDEFGRTVETIGNSGTGLGTRSRTTTDAYDLLGNPLSSSTWSTDTGSFGGQREVESFHEIYNGITRPQPAGTQGPIAPSGAPAPLCPDGSGERCTAVTSFDIDGQPIALTDAYGIVDRTFLDLAGRTVFSIANYGDGVFSDSDPDRDIVNRTLYDILGRADATTDVLGRSSATSFDALGRALAVRTYDSAGTAVSKTRTTYTAGGRVDLQSAPGPESASDSALDWTKTVYDRAGRATRTLANWQYDGRAGMAVESFEATSADVTLANDGIAESWAATGTFLGAGATLSRGTDATGAVSGLNRLEVDLGTGSNQGAEWKLDGTFKAGRTYRARVWVRSTGGFNVAAKLGTAAGSPASQTVTPTAVWSAIDVSWTVPAGGDLSDVRLAVFRPSSGAAATFWIDNAVVWDQGEPNANIPTESVHDGASLLVASILPPGVPGAAGDEPHVTRTSYDAAGRMTRVNINEVAGSSGSDRNLDTDTDHDGLGRVVESVDPTGTVTRYAFDRLGQQTDTWLNWVDGTSPGATSDEDVHSTFAYNAAGELIRHCPAVQVLAGCDPSVSGETRAWRYTFDAAANLTSQIPPVNSGTGSQLANRFWTYDPGGRLTGVCDDTATSCTGTVGKSRNSVPAYDDLGRVTGLDTYGGAGQASGDLALRTETVYLGDGQVARTRAYEGAGSTPTLVDTIDATYDSAGRPDLLKRGSTVLTDFAWNADGTLLSRDDLEVGLSSFAYDWADRITSANLPDGITTANPTFAWRADGLVGSRTYTSSTEQLTFSYDRAKRLTEIARTGLSLTQTYDRDGNVTAEARTISGVAGHAGSGTQTFSYDDLNRVTGSSGLTGAAWTYTYDHDGNRQTKSDGTTTWSYSYHRTDQLASVTRTGNPSQPFTYNAYGDLTGKLEDDLTTTGYAYDLAGKLTAIDRPGTADDASFTFDALGRFRTRVTAGLTETYGYLGTTESVVRIERSTGDDVSSLVDSAGDRLAVASASTVNWFVPDPHGNVAAQLSADESSVTDALRYDAWGEILAWAAETGAPAAAAPETWAYQGRLDLSPDGVEPLYDMSARFYSPSLGVFTQLDSVMGSAQDPRTMNRFLYAHANPATLIDPTGRSITNPGQVCPYGPEDCASINWTPKNGKLPTSGAGKGGTKGGGGGFDYCSIPTNCDPSPKNAPVFTTPYAEAAGIPAAWINQIAPMFASLDACGVGCMTDETGYVYDPSGWENGREILAPCVGSPDLRACLIQMAIYESQMDPNGALYFVGGIFAAAACMLGCGAILAGAASLGTDVVIGARVLLSTGSMSAACGVSNCYNHGANAAALVCEAVGACAPGSVGWSSGGPVDELCRAGAACSAVPGSAAIGHMDVYRDLGDALGIKYFYLSDDVWDAMSPAQRTLANRDFLDDLIISGDDVLLATPLNAVRPGSALEWEIDYLLGHGYTMSPDGWRLVAP